MQRLTPSMGPSMEPSAGPRASGRWGVLLLLALWTLQALALVDESELLDPNDAFAIEAKAVSRDLLEVHWTIAPGYYMYRHRINFRAETENDDVEIVLGELDLPDGKRYVDEFFGEVETYRDALTVKIPIAELPAGIDHFNLKARSQGCADLGVCYPPHQQIIPITLPATATDAGMAFDPAPAGSTLTPTGLPGAQNGVLNLQQALNNLTGGTTEGLVDDEALPAEQAFVVEAISLDAGKVLARLTPAPGYYIYRDKIAFSSQDKAIRIQQAALPAGEKHEDEHFGTVEIYRDQVEVPLTLARPAGPATQFSLLVELQGCKERGICYPPMKRMINVSLPVATAAIGGQNTDAKTGSAQAAGEGQSIPAEQAQTEQDFLAGVLRDSPVYAMLLFFVAGILLAFTPCVFPMVPILSGIIAGQGDNISTQKAFFLSLAYVLAMAITYALVGVVAASFGENLQAWFQQPWVLWSFAILFVVLSLAMFGFYNLQLPAGLQARLTNISNSQQGGTLIGVAVMGLLSALVVGPCVAPALMAALIYIGQTGDSTLGGLALFAMGLGMGVPLIAFGTSAGRLMPRAGTWMEAVKAFFGVGLLALALWMLDRTLSGHTMLLLWSFLFIGSGVYLGALEPVPEMASGWRKLWKSLGVVVLLFGALQVVGFAMGGDDWTRPLHGLRAGGGGVSATGHAEEAQFKRIKSLADLKAELGQGRPVMLDFYADWCVECKRMEKYTFPEAIVQQRLAEYTLLQADVTAFDDEDKALVNAFKLLGPPAILYFNGKGDELSGLRMIGYMDAEEFSAHLDKVQAAL